MTIISLIGFCILFMGNWASAYNPLLTGLVQVIAAIVLYFVTVIWVTKKNWLDFRAVFTGVWLGTIGLAAMRLTEYQEQWQTKTWFLLALSYLIFEVGISIGVKLIDEYYQKIQMLGGKLKVKNFGFSLQESRLFLICIVTTVIGLVCFIINIKIKGFIPAFSNNTNAYMDFYTKFHVFAVAATAISGLCYYCIKTQKLNWIKKLILWICIFYLVILFPVLVVSRGVFIVAALSLTTTVFYLNDRKLIAFVICLATMAGIYLFTSNLRGYTEEQLAVLFEPSNVVISNSNQQENGKDEQNNNQNDEVNKNEIVQEEQIKTFTLPPRAAFLYGYLTVSHDNFNEAVENTVGYTWGARQLYPFNVILRIPAIQNAIDNGEYYLVRPHLNTVNMLGVFYYDFHEWGIVLGTLIWAIILGIIQELYMKSKGIMALLVLGNSMNIVALSFFSSWVDSFEIWMFWGVILIVAMISSVKKR